MRWDGQHAERRLHSRCGTGRFDFALGGNQDVDIAPGRIKAPRRALSVGYDVTVSRSCVDGALSEHLRAHNRSEACCSARGLWLPALRGVGGAEASVASLARTALLCCPWVASPGALVKIGVARSL